ncbi:MAG TPA: phenylacetic acid degradation operon negative regulatory protein PaaX [Steroidobacteraceae bacterium]|nr:phenylacetic acid degradation operon negative regulatory protein PaaX [Steroidobacteraceae bacterium]
MSERLTQATHTLVARFQRQRPVRSGSLLITVFGDAIAPRGGTVTLGSLIRLAQPFGIPERLVRTSVGRLAQEGWLEFRRSGRQSEYFLTEHGRSRFAEATQRIYAAGPADWDGHWTLIFVSPGPRARRERIREEMAWLGFGQITADMLAHPSRSVADTRSQLTELRLDGAAVILRAASEGPDADQALLQAGWDLGELARSYQRFVASFQPVQALLNGRTVATPETAFVIRTLLIHQYRKIHLRDPLLPHSLLPADWIGAQAYELCRDLYRRVFAAAEEHISATAETLAGKLAPPTRDTYTRFGGLDAAERHSR